MKRYLLVFNIALLAIATATAGADQVLFDGSQKVSGLTVAPDPEDATNQVAFWKNAPKGFRRPLLTKEVNLSKYKGLSFRFYSAKADNNAICVLADSNPDNWDKAGNYYYKKFIVDWRGWKTVVLPFADFIHARKPVGWKKINQIMFANNGYGGAKANTEAQYYIDDLKALDEVPARVLKEGESVKLSTTNGSEIFQFPIDPAKEHIYGIQYELRGAPGAQARLRSYQTWDVNQDPRQRVDLMGSKWKPVATNDWETKQVEILTKKGSARLGLTIAIHGDIPVELRNVKVVKGGFPDHPPLPEAPYLDWIDSLRTNLDYAKASPLLIYKEGGSSIWNHRGGRYVALNEEDQAKAEAEVAPYLDLPVSDLIKLVPTKRPFSFNSGCWGLKYDWNPKEPNIIRNKETGAVFDPTKEFPIQGYEEVTAPSGKKVKYAYHDYHEKDHTGQPAYVEHFKEGARIYVDRFMTDARLNAMHRAGTLMAMLYRKTGDMEYGVRAAAILWATARNMPDWPVHGKPGWNSPVKKIHLQDPDFYSWFSFVMGGDWYVTEGNIMWTTRYFDLLRDTPVWTELSKREKAEVPLQETADGLLHIAKMYLERDAFYRNSPFVMFHNLSGTEHRNYIVLGRALGVPDMVHYALRKIIGTFDKVFMVDGVFPESQWYTLDQYGRQSQALDCLNGYNDPPGYKCSLDGSRLDITDPTTSIPAYKRIRQALYRQTFPDGSAFTIHDSWSHTANPPKSYSIHFPEREETSPFLFHAYGHGVLGRGKKPNRIEAQLHYSGKYNHGHMDMLNFNFWAYGDELLSDIGYSHITSYNSATASHNLVMVNKSSQKPGHPGSLVCWNARKGSSQVVQADQGSTPAYPECSIYRRSLVLLPFGDDRNAVLDIFEVAGGNRHDWMANGCADYQQILTSTLKPEKTLDNLAANGVAIEDSYPWGADQASKYKGDTHGQESIWYGAFRNAKITSIKSAWTATMSPTPPVPADTPWAGPRAKSAAPKPSLKLHWLYPMDGKAILAEAPRNRYLNELQHKPEARKVWAKNRMPKIIVSREGKNLKSTFASLWEPYHQNSFLTDVGSLDGLAGNGFGWVFGDDKSCKTVLYRPAESKDTLTSPKLTSDGRFTILTETLNTTDLDLYDGSMARTPTMQVSTGKNTALPVKSMTTDQDKVTVVLSGSLPHSPDRSVVNYGGQFVCFSQPGQSNRWLKVNQVVYDKDETKLILSDDPGFTFDAATGVLNETYFPYRVSTAPAKVTLPSWVNLKKSDTETGIRLLVRASSLATLEFSEGIDFNVDVSARRPGAEWELIPFTIEDGKLILKLDPTKCEGQWLEVVIKKQ